MFIRHNYLLLPTSTKARVWSPSKEAPIHVVDGFVWNPFRERFEDVRGATYLEIIASLGINHLIGFGVGSSFAAITNTYNSGTAASETIPTNSSNVAIDSWGGGAGGGRPTGAGNGASGGSGGSYCQLTRPVLSGEWGTSLTYTVGPGGAGRTVSSGSGTNGTPSTVTGTLNGGAISMSAGRGTGGVAAGTGQTSVASSGGDTNTTGGASSTSSGLSGTNGGDAAGGGGTGGIGGLGVGPAGNPPGGGGAGGGSDGGGTGLNGGNGQSGRITFAWT